MPFLPVFLTTDVLLWLLVCVSAGYGWGCRRHAHLAAPWGGGFQTRPAVVSVVILTPYLLVGLADSLHFRTRLEQVGAGSAASYSPEVLSLLDIAASHLRSRREKTYSAPFATRLYAKEQIELADGRQVRDFPRLQYGGAHPPDQEERGGGMSRRAGARPAAAGGGGVGGGWVGGRLVDGRPPAGDRRASAPAIGGLPRVRHRQGGAGRSLSFA